MRGASTDGLPLTVPSRVPPMRVQARLTPCEYPEYPMRVQAQLTPSEYPEYPDAQSGYSGYSTGYSDAHTPPTGREYSRASLRCRAARSPAAANGTGPAAGAAPGTPPAHAGTPSTVPSHPAGRDIDRDIVRRWGPAPASGCVASRAGGRPCRVRLRFSVGRALSIRFGTQGSHASTHSTASTPRTQRAHAGPRRERAALLSNCE